jgi:hypothetical protein
VIRRLGHSGLDVAGRFWNDRFILVWFFEGFLRKRWGFCGFVVVKTW